MAQGLIRDGMSTDSEQVGQLVDGQIYEVTKMGQWEGITRYFVGSGWVSPVAKSGKPLLVEPVDEKDDDKRTREQCEASVRSYLQFHMSGPSLEPNGTNLELARYETL